MLNILDEIVEFGGLKRKIIVIVISLLFLIFSFFNIHFTYIVIVLCGIPIVIESIIGLSKFDIKADFLVSVALIASLIIGELFAAAEVVFIMQLGEMLEELTVDRAKQDIEKLYSLNPKTARVIKDNQELIIPIEKIKIDDIIKIYPYEMIPVDGVIISGQTSIDEKNITGESIPSDKQIGDEVKSGCINQHNTFIMKAIKDKDDSYIQRIIKLVKLTDGTDAKIVRMTDKFATWLVVIALLSSVICYFMTNDIIRAVTILVVFCPCSFILATPTAIIATISNISKYGFLVKNGDSIQKLNNIDTVVFDKTGTLTSGTLKVLEIKNVSNELSIDELYYIFASVENNSQHPIAKAIVSHYKEMYNKELMIPKQFEVLIGNGLKAVIDDKNIIIGNQSLVNGVSLLFDDVKDYLEKGFIVVYISINDKCVGFVVLSDEIRVESEKIVNDLRKINIKSVLLTGDNERVAKYVADKVNIKEYKATCLPEDKMNYIEQMQNAKHKVCMIGDGVNDAPSLKKSNIGIAIRGIGSDIAVESADIICTTNSLKGLTHLFLISKKMLSVIKMNITFSLTLNILGIILAFFAILNPVSGALVHNAGSLIVIINSILLLKWVE